MKTPEERADEIAYDDAWLVGGVVDGGVVVSSERLAKSIAAAIREAVEEEREACAKMSDSVDLFWMAAAIRARSETQKE